MSARDATNTANVHATGVEHAEATTTIADVLALRQENAALRQRLDAAVQCARAWDAAEHCDAACSGDATRNGQALHEVAIRAVVTARRLTAQVLEHERSVEQ